VQKQNDEVKRLEVRERGSLSNVDTTADGVLAS
jgi:hypothetical protein